MFFGTPISGHAQAFLVKNINTRQDTVGSAPAFFVSVGNNVFYFRANDGIHGTELWRSDGTAEGTSMVADINAGGANADPASLVNANGTLFFTATDAEHGRELWKSDGTEAGTMLVIDITPGPASSNPANLTAVSNVVYFTAFNPGLGTELWMSDGAQRTGPVKDIIPGPGSSNPANLTPYNNKLFFSANNVGATTNGVELWITDGTPGNTVMVKDINPGPASSNPQNFVVLSNAFTTNTLFFTANDGIHGTELWRSDGTDPGTFPVKDIFPGPSSSNPQNLVNVGGTLFFSALGGTNTGIELWKSDGFDVNTVLVKDINPGPTNSSPQNLVNVNGSLFFTATFPGFNSELWKSDGTSNNTVIVKDIFLGSPGFGPTNLVNVNGTLFFSANNSTNGNELWKSDGTDAGTVLVKDIRPGALSSSPQNLANINGTLIFSADDGVLGRELWRSDGTADGTFMIQNIRNSDGDSNPTNLVNLNGTLIFAANDGTNGTELWKSDGTDEGTVLLKDISLGTNNSNPLNLVRVQDTVFFSADDLIHGRELWKTDGTTDGTVLVKDINAVGSSSPSSLVNFNGMLVFTANDPTNGVELWKSDGTENGTVIVANLTTNFGGSSFPTNLLVVGNILYFSASVPGIGTELWETDGTAEHTFLVKDISAGPASSNPSRLTAIGYTLFFTANVTNVGTELWMSDGTPDGTVMVSDIFPGPNGSNPQNLTVVSNMLFFSAIRDLTNGIELWKTDGTSEGTVQVKNINSSPNGNSNPQNLINVNGTLFFSATSGTNFGTELWKSDGTDQGTVMVKDINTVSSNSIPQNLFTVNGKLYFSATDGINGRELWQSDGTEEGTFMVANITEDSSDSNPGPFTVAGDTLYFAAQTAAVGRELFGFVLNHAPVVANPIPDQQGVFGGSFSFTVPPDTFSDEDADQTLTYTASGLPPGIGFDVPTATFSGTFAAAGQFTVSVVATDNGGPIPLSATNTFEINVEKANPVVTWQTPADIVYGTALGGAQLNATANVAGAFAYAPAAGTVLHAGQSQLLSVAFGPEDTANYNPASATVSINVLKANLTATAANKSRTYGSTNPPLTINYSGFVNGDSAGVIDSAPVVSTIATPASPVGTYPITLTGGSDNDYNLVLVNGTLTIAPAALTVTANNATKVYGQPNPAFTGSIVGILNNDNITATYSASATDTSLVGTYAIVPSVVDPDGKIPNYNVTLVNGTLTITPAALTVTITGPPSGFVERVNTNVPFFGTFTKSGVSDSYLASWTFSREGMSDVVVPGVVSNDTVSAAVPFAEDGIYSYSLTVTNEFGPSAIATNVNNDLPAYVVIYDPNGGFVTGGGWFDSPVGAYSAQPGLSGKATFGFLTKYQVGQGVPSGETQFDFKAAGLSFRSTSYDWLVISGAKAQYKGSGTINDAGDFAFIVTAVDGHVSGGTDTLRMKIWNKQSNQVIYDNQPGAADNANPTTPVHGSVVLHQQ
jgi:ELWxxDGT repeat protein